MLRGDQSVPRALDGAQEAQGQRCRLLRVLGTGRVADQTGSTGRHRRVLKVGGRRHQRRRARLSFSATVI